MYMYIQGIKLRVRANVSVYLILVPFKGTVLRGTGTGPPRVDPRVTRAHP
jgi:hypothetical protein